MNAAVGCETCHGRIDQMIKVYQAKPLTMEWCINCHKDPAPNLREPENITKMGYEPQPGEGEAVMKRNSVHPPLNCSTCHRLGAEQHVPAKEPHDHQAPGHEHGHGHDHDHDHDAPLAPIPPTPSHGYWKSMRELAGTAAWQLKPSRKEMPEGTDPSKAPVDPLSRRNFFHLMGSAAGLAGIGAAAAGCQRYDKEEIVPLARRPEDETPGITQEYSTAWSSAASVTR